MGWCARPPDESCSSITALAEVHSFQLANGCRLPNWWSRATKPLYDEPCRSQSQQHDRSRLRHRGCRDVEDFATHIGSNRPTQNGRCIECKVESPQVIAGTRIGSACHSGNIESRQGSRIESQRPNWCEN